MCEALRLIFSQVRSKLSAKFGYFEIYSCDFVLEADNLDPKLVDINSNPNFATNMTGSKDVIYTLLRDVATMVSDLHEPGTTRGKPDLVEKVFKCAQQEYDIVYSDL